MCALHVLELSQRFRPAIGGVEEHVWHLAHGLAACGDDVEVVTTDLRKESVLERLTDVDASHDVEVRRVRARKALPLPHGLGNVAPGMLTHVLFGRWDVIHGHAYGYFPTFAASTGGLMNRSAVVLTPHSDPGVDSASKRLFDKVVPQATLRLADRVIALTASEGRYLERLRVDPGRIRVIPNGVDMAEFAHIPPRRPKADPITILFVGRLYPRQKGLEYLIAAFAVAQSRRKARLRLVGDDWGGRTALQTLASSLGVGRAVEFVGELPRTRVIREYESADLFVLPSLFEPFGIVLLEAMAAGLPIIASRVGGIPDVIEDGRTGILVEPRNVQALADAIDSLVADPSLRMKMGAEGRAQAAKYSWDRLVPRIRSVYEEAV